MIDHGFSFRTAGPTFANHLSIIEIFSNCCNYIFSRMGRSFSRLKTGVAITVLWRKRTKRRADAWAAGAIINLDFYEIEEVMAESHVVSALVAKRARPSQSWGRYRARVGIDLGNGMKWRVLLELMEANRERGNTRAGDWPPTAKCDFSGRDCGRDPSLFS
jgi:hypothetical protein